MSRIYFDLHDSEARAIHRLIEQVRQKTMDADPSVRAFNIGVNSGPRSWTIGAACRRSPHPPAGRKSKDLRPFDLWSAGDSHSPS
jgi:hypothetical protein